MRRREFLAQAGTAGFSAVTAAARPSLAWAQSATGAGYSDGYANGDGAKLYFVRAGDGPLMLFLHGHPDNWSLYDAQIREFSRDHLVVAPNLRGYPPSDAPLDVEAYAMPRLLGDLHGLLDYLGRERCILAGNDWGGCVAWVFASAYPTRVERLIILNAPHPAIFLREVRSNPAQIKASQYERTYNAAASPYPRWYNYYRADPVKVPASIEEAKSMTSPDLPAHFFAGVARPPEATSLQVRVPTQVIWGMTDEALLPGSLEGLDAYAQDLKIVRLTDAGHLPMRTHASAVNLAIRDFLRRPG